MDDWYYAADNTRYGPITGELVQQLAVRGVIRAETPMWRAGMAEWQTYGQLTGGNVPTPPAPEPAVVEQPKKEELTQTRPIQVSVSSSSTRSASQMGKSKPKAATFEYGELKLTESDKDLYVQGVLEGVDSVGKEWILAGFWVRVLASFIDGVVFVLAFLGVMLLFGMLGRQLMALGTLAPFVIVVIQFALVYWYWIWPMTTSRQATLGKRILGLRVIRGDGADLKLGTALARFFGYYPSSAVLYLGFLNAAFDREKRTFHDMLCDTRVIYH